VRQYTPQQLTVPAGTSSSSPSQVGWSCYPGWVHTFRIDIPSGHNRLTGVRLSYMQRPVVPFHPTLWLVGNGTTFTVPWEDEILSNGLLIQGYNTDSFEHTFYLFADVDPYEQLPTINIRAPVAPGSPSPARAANIALLGQE
jgi:hypothetical protein